MTVAFYLHFCYSIPSLLLYALTIYVCIRDSKELKGTFYTIYKVSFIIDTLSYLANFLCLWILCVHSFNEWFLSLNEYPLLLEALVYINKITLHGQNFRCMLSCFHRLTSIAWPFGYNQFWDKMTVPLLCLIPVWGAVVGSYALFLGLYLQDTNGQVYWEFRNPVLSVYPILAMTIFYFFIMGIPSVCTIRLLIKHNKDAIAANICRITLCCTIIQVINLLTMGAVGVSQMYRFNISQFLEIHVMPITRDAYTFCYPWFTFLINRDVHRRVCALLHLRGDKVASTQGSTNGGHPSHPPSTAHLPTMTATEATEHPHVTFTLDAIDMEKDL